MRLNSGTKLTWAHNYLVLLPSLPLPFPLTPLSLLFLHPLPGPFFGSVPFPPFCSNPCIHLGVRRGSVLLGVGVLMVSGISSRLHLPPGQRRQIQKQFLWITRPSFSQFLGTFRALHVWTFLNRLRLRLLGDQWA